MRQAMRLHQLTNVSSVEPDDGQILTWDAAAGEWKPTTIDVPEPQTGLVYAVGQATADHGLNDGSYASMSGLSVTAPESGTYLMLLQLEMKMVTADAGMAVNIQLYKNGVLAYGNIITWEPLLALTSGTYANDEIEMPYHYHSIYTLNAGDVLQPRFQVSGGDGLSGGSEINSTYSRITLIKLA